MSQHTILLIEDNIDDIELIKIALETSGIPKQIEVAMDGEEAMDYLFGNSQNCQGINKNRPDLILLDIQLPRISGLEVLEKIRKNDETRPIPVVIFSSSIEEKDISKAYCLRANSYVRKPVDGQAFEQAVQRIESYWLELNKAPECKMMPS